MWHWDFVLSDSDSLNGLLIFTFFSRVPSRGGTLILSGSHHLLRSYYHILPQEQRNIEHAKHRKRFLEWHPWIAALAGRNPDMSSREEDSFFEMNKMLIFSMKSSP